MEALPVGPGTGHAGREGLKRLASVGILVFVLGLVVGSFINVIAYRLPRGESIVFPPSHCPACGHRLGPGDLVPVISYLTLRGRCRYCRAPISVRYPIFETLTGVLYLLIFVNRGLTAGTLVGLVLAALMVAVAAADLGHQRIPNQLTFTGLGVGLVFGLFGQVGGSGGGLPGLWASVLGAVVCAGFLLATGYLVSAFTHRDEIGLGDVKLALTVGAMLGWDLGLFGIYLGVIAALLVMGVLMVARVARLRTPIPFGLYMALGSVASFLWGRPLINAYMSFLSR